MHPPRATPSAAGLAGRALALAVVALSVAGCAGPGAEVGGQRRPSADGAGPPMPPAALSPKLPAGPGAQASPAEVALGVLLRFCDAGKAGRWPEAWSLLSARWRGALTPEQLAADWAGAGPLAREAAERVEAQALARVPLTGSGRELRLLVAPGRAARLVEEGGAWRVDALE